MLTKKQRLEQYGISSDMQVLGMIERVCDIFGNGSSNAAKINIEKLIRHESHFGNIKDHSKEHGESICQIDEPTFDWIIDKCINDYDYKDECTLFQKYYYMNLEDIDYEHIRYLPEISIVLCRLRYKFVPEAFPIDDDGMWYYYKTH